MSRILVTGASGYVALHVIDQLLKAGHFVRGTVRSLKDEKKVEPIRKLASDSNSLELVEANLLDADSWKIAVNNIEIVIHVASPLPSENPADEQEVIKPAVEGTLNVLNAALNTNVRRVVVTSSGLTVFGYGMEDRTYSENDWADETKMPTAYGKSKVLAERAAWNFIEEQKKLNKSCFELAVIHPVLVLGPVLSTADGSSAKFFLNVFNNKSGQVPNFNFPCCDVRDVAAAHIKAAFLPEAAGQRHVITSSPYTIAARKWAVILKEEFEPKGYSISTQYEPEVQKGKIDDHRMINVLGIKPTDFEKTLKDMANSFIELGLIKK